MALGIYLKDKHLEYSVHLLCGIKRKTEGSWTNVGRNAAGSCYQKLRSYYQITARPCHPEEEEEKEEQQKGEMQFFDNIFSLDFLTF